MTDNVVNFTEPKELMPARWRKHAEALNQTCSDIRALHKRLHQETREFLDVRKEDMTRLTYLVIGRTSLLKSRR